jgi:hypothetical protein
LAAGVVLITNQGLTPLPTLLKPTCKKTNISLSHELRSKWPKNAPEPQKINVDNQARFRYWMIIISV